MILRADASINIGTGHLMRCLALAQAWQATGEHAVFVKAMQSLALENQLKSKGMKIIHLTVQPGSADDAMQTRKLIDQVSASWIVLDGYHFTAGYQRIIKESGLRLLAIDDNGHSEHYYADIILNQNIHAHESMYNSREPYTRILLGTRYVLLRREFLEWRGWKRRIPALSNKVLVTMGGSDPDNVTLKVILALQQMRVKSLEAIVLVGANNPHYQKLQCAVQNSHVPMRLERNVSNVAELMAWADMAISGGGSTCWELAFMGVPFIVLILAQNQEGIVNGLEENEAAVNCGWFHKLSTSQLAECVEKLIIDKKRRANYSVKARQLVDGLGAERILDQMRVL